jgi:dienelactone hydrolase
MRQISLDFRAGRSVGSFEALLVVLIAAVLLFTPTALAQGKLGSQGIEGKPDREQQWLVPSPDPAIPSRAILYRPPGDGPFRLAVIAHDSTQNVLYRALKRQPEYRALAARLVARRFAVLVPERPGHGATGGEYLEDQRGCDGADYSRSGRATAEEISAALNYLRGQAFIRQDGVVIVGHSAGGWGALALAGADPQAISAVVLFAPGRGGDANDVPHKICAPHMLVATASEFGRGARVPVTWLVAANDTYYPPEFSRKLADAFRRGGGKVLFRVLPAAGGEGHWLAEKEAGMKTARAELDRALKLPPTRAKER